VSYNAQLNTFMKTLKNTLIEKYGLAAADEENWRMSSDQHPSGIFTDLKEMCEALGHDYDTIKELRSL
jgi:hypothetical protein